MRIPDAVEGARPATWMLLPGEHCSGERPLLLVPLSDEEMAATLGIPVEQSRELRTREPMYFCLPTCRLCPN